MAKSVEIVIELNANLVLIITKTSLPSNKHKKIGIGEFYFGCYRKRQSAAYDLNKFIWKKEVLLRSLETFGGQER